MALSIDQISLEGLKEQKLVKWAGEIRNYLLGGTSLLWRLEFLTNAQTDELSDPPIRLWWTFDAKPYLGLEGPLSKNWDEVLGTISRLVETFNPRLRFSSLPDGVVNWAQTLARGPHRLRQEYVVHSSAPDSLRTSTGAVSGWLRWIRGEWEKYKKELAPTVNWPMSDDNSSASCDMDQLRRWAYIARRSRWPILHGVIAESMGPLLEPQELDRIPLPADEARLFELVCLVRIAQKTAPPPRELRWLTAGNNNNSVALEGVKIHYQQWLDEKRVLDTYGDELASAIDFFGVRLPRQVDVAFDFLATRSGFDGIY